MSRMFILYLFSLTLRSLVFAAIAGVAMAATRKVHLRHAIGVLVLWFLFVMPLADALLPSTFVPSSVPEIVRPIQTFIVVSPPAVTRPPADATLAFAESQVDWWEAAAGLILAVTVVLLIRLLAICIQVAGLKRASRPVSDPMWDSVKNLSVRESDAISVPLTVGLWKPFLLLPASWRDWDSWKLNAVLTHECTHVKRGDWATALVAAVAKCLFWFNPLVWWLEKRLASLAEQASDEACVQRCGDAPRYAETLLEFASASRQGHRWIGGVAMAHYKISQRIERILALRRPGSGVLPRPAWALLFVVTLPLLYVSAAAQSGRKVPAHDVLELQQVLQPLLAPIAALPVEVRPQTAAPETPQPPPRIPAPEAAPTAPSPVQPATPQQVPPVIQPDLVGEIRLILAPVEVQLLPAPGQVEIRTNSGTSRYTGTAVWNVATNPAPPNSWNLNTFWNLGGGTVAFALTGIEGRKALFEDRGGNTFSYGCSNCTFLVSQSGVGTMPANPDAGIAFQLSPDGRSLSATCHASECRVGLPIGNTRDGTVGGGGFLAGSLLSLTVRNAETATVGIGKSTNGVCFNVGGNRKVDGTPFTDADCDRLPSILYFSLTR